MEWSGRRVLVTGAGGFIGSHLTEALVQAGAATRAFVRYNAAGSRGWLDHSECQADIEFVPGDICDRDSVTAAMRDRDVVFHLAALIAIPYSYQAPSSYVRTNVQGTVNVLQAMRESNTQRLVHTSTSEVYGTARYTPIDENHPLQAQSPYAASKIGADKLAEAFHCSFELPIVTVRPFNTFGPRQSARAVIPAIISQCLGQDVVSLGNLKPTRDLNYVASTVDGFMRAGVLEGLNGRTINVGSGDEISIGGLAELIIGLVGRSVELKSDPSRKRPGTSEVERLVADNSLATELMDYRPVCTLEEGLQQTIAWMRDNQASYRPDVYAI